MRWVATVFLMLGWGFSAASAKEPLLLSKPTTADNADRALVLVHGLLGSPSQSFGKWPQLIASDDTHLPGHGKISDFAVYAVDYEADFASRSTLEDLAKGVSGDLEASPIFRRHRHIWFVTHSMGGLVLKRTLALWKLRGKTVLLDRIIGVGMLGVPSAGAPLADLAATGGIGAIATYFGWNGGLVQDLTTDAGQRFLDSLENDWIAIKETRDSGAIRKFTPIFNCGYETKPELRIVEIVFGPKYGTIVPKLFATSACDDKRGFPVSHTELTKPDDLRAPVHGWLRDLIVRSVTGAVQEQRDAITTAPEVPSYVASRVERSNEELEPANLDRATGLPREPERIDFADDRSRAIASKLILRGGPFYGGTKSDLWEAIAKKNTCIETKVSPNRLLITLVIRDETLTCRGGQSFVCANQACN